MRKPLLALAALALMPTSSVSGADSAVLRIRASADVVRCVERAVGTMAGVVVEEGNPAVTTNADVIVGAEAGLTRALEGGLADGRTVVDLGMGVWVEKRPSMVIGALVAASPRANDARRLLDRLSTRDARQAFAACSGLQDARAWGEAQGAAVVKPGLARYATAVADWWLPVCSQSANIFNDTSEVVGAPNAVALGGKDNYRGFMSLGQGGWIVVDMGQTIQNGPGSDIRVYQSQADEPVTLYAGDAPGGPFKLVAFRRYCGNRAAGLFSGYCDFDLAEAGIGSTRYLRIEDGELYPCLRGGTKSEGADIDAVELLSP